MLVRVAFVIVISIVEDKDSEESRREVSLTIKVDENDFTKDYKFVNSESVMLREAVMISKSEGLRDLG